MQLPAPVTLNPPGLGRPVTLTSVDVTLLDSHRLKKVQAHLRPFVRPLTLWEGDAYDAAGDYTQAQAEARILELLGPDIKAGLEALFVPPVRG